MRTIAQSFVTEQHIQDYNEKGFFILENVIEPSVLEELRAFAARKIEEKDAEMDAQGVEKMNLNVKGRRYFMHRSFRENRANYDYVFSSLFEDICRAIFGGTAYLSNDQYVVKSADVGAKFSWHQDSGYAPFDHKPYITCWAALDDMSEANGTAYMLPYTEIGVKTRVTHVRDPEMNDMVGYFGDHPGIPVICPAGSVAVFSSVCFHRTGANTTENPRRVLVSQYTSEIRQNPLTGKFHGENVPFLNDGVRVVPQFEALKL